MQKTRTKRMFLVAAVAVALVFSVGTAYAAVIGISGPTEVQPGESFTIDVNLVSTSSIALDDVDFWNLGLHIWPDGMYDNAKFVENNLTTSQSNYIFFGNSFAYDIVTDKPANVVVKASDARNRDDTPPGNLLSRIQIDVLRTAQVCEWYEIDLEVPISTWNFVGDAAGNIELLEFDSSKELYRFHVVPIPGAFWLLGSGVFGLLALRRRKK